VNFKKRECYFTIKKDLFPFSVYKLVPSMLFLSSSTQSFRKIFFISMKGELLLVCGDSCGVKDGVLNIDM